ncbi:LETM1 domain-containing protein 1 isoform X1 [Drosophila nasuta]|uniref:LETM1 domain-containing protein 1 isoform X1 n=1 Tax=Drosophila nasuta TaxID=42062 RepID=UPI00295F307F|nr:LETM1 domain-containing protein 1 isoform X1 [Drosophila nasuta]
MALALRVACSTWRIKWPQEHRCLQQLKRSSVVIAQQSHYTTNASQQQQQPKPQPTEAIAAATPPQIKRNVASEITSVGKAIYEARWDAKQTAKQQQSAGSMSTSTEQQTGGDHDKDKKKDNMEVLRSKREQMRDNMQDYIFTRYFNYVKNYDKVLEKNFPKAMQLYRVFFDGVKDFFADMKRFLKIARIANDAPQGIRALNRQELELYMQMPRDMMKVAPALIGCSLPMVGYAFFPLVFWYPRTFLTSHFWTEQQRNDFQSYYMKRRLQCNKSVFRCLQAKLKSLKTHHKHAEFESILGQLGSGTHPTADALIAVKDIFAEGPYSLLGMSRKHIKCLVKMHGLPNSLFKRHRLHEHAFLVHYMDLAINREGGVHNLRTDAMRYCCYLRGLNPDNLSREEMIEWLRNWVKVSTSIQGEHITLFLHLPILLGYNHPRNWKTIYCKSTTEDAAS